MQQPTPKPARPTYPTLFTGAETQAFPDLPALIGDLKRRFAGLKLRAVETTAVFGPSDVFDGVSLFRCREADGWVATIGGPGVTVAAVTAGLGL